MLTASAFSLHYDASYKALLFAALARRRSAGDRIVVLPEVGPFGFDLLVARCAGFSRFIAYDKDLPTVQTAQAFHTGVQVEYTVSSSAAFDFARYSSPEHLVVFPDWPHDDLERRLAGFDNLVRYSSRAEGTSLRTAQRRLRVSRLPWGALFEAMGQLA